MSPQKILMVNIGFMPESVGGTEYYTYNLSKSLLQKGYGVTVLAASEDLTSKRYQVTQKKLEGIKVIKIANSPLLARSFTQHFINLKIDDLFRELVREEEPDLIHFQHIAYLSGNFPEIAHEMNIPSIFTLHDYWYICFRSRLLRPGCEICSGPKEGSHCATCHDESTTHPMAVSRSPLLINMINHPAVRNLVVGQMHRVPQPLISQARKLLFAKPQVNHQQSSVSFSSLREYKFRYDFFKRQLQYPRFLLSPSDHLKKRYEEQGYTNILVLPLGFSQVEKGPMLPFNKRLNIAFVGNIERHKGVIVLLQELLPLRKQGNVQINIYGRAKDPVYFTELKAIAKQFPQEMIRFHGGFRSDRDLKEIFSQNHVMVFPSIWEENAPLVVREALLHGVPVVGSNLGGMPEIISEGVNGLLFDPYIEGDLLTKIDLILNEPELLKRITLGARNAQIESMSDHVLKLTGLYKRALHDHLSR